MINTAIKYLKKELSKSKLNDDLNEEVSNEFVDTIDDFDNYKLPESSDELIALFQWLPDGYRTILNLYAIESLSHQQIAHKLNISIGTSKSQLSKARKMLKKIILNKVEKSNHEVERQYI
jgi:RNA polymerase sigma-70 factor (ECF subfamily)